MKKITLKKGEQFQVQSIVTKNIYTVSALKIEDDCVCGYHLEENDNQYWWVASRFKEIKSGDAEMAYEIVKLKNKIFELESRIKTLENAPRSVCWSYGSFK